MSIPVFKPSIRRKEMDAVLTSMISDSIGPGQIVEQLTKRLCLMFNAGDGVLLREYKAAIRTALRSLNLDQPSKALLSPLTPAIYLEVFKEFEITPVFADVDPFSGCIKADSVSKADTDEIKFILIYHNLGIVPDIGALQEFGIPVIEDISESFGGCSEEIRSKSDSFAVILGMEPEYIITSGGGAAVLVRNAEAVHKLAILKNEYDRTSILPDMNAAMADIQLNYLDGFIQKRQEIYELFTKALMKTRHRTLLQPGEIGFCPFTFSVVTKSAVKPIIKYAMKGGIDVQLAFSGSSLSRQGYESTICPEASKLLLSTLIFPLYPSLISKDVQQISRVLSTLP